MPDKKTETTTVSPTKTIIGVNNLIAIGVLISAYFYMVAASLFPQTLTQENNDQTAKQDSSATSEAITVSSEDYKKSMTDLYQQYEQDPVAAEKINDQSKILYLGKVQKLKEASLALKVPTEFMELHLKFVSALTDIQNATSEEVNTDAINQANDSISNLKKEYDWLDQ